MKNELSSRRHISAFIFLLLLAVILCALVYGAQNGSYAQFTPRNDLPLHVLTVSAPTPKAENAAQQYADAQNEKQLQMEQLLGALQEGALQPDVRTLAENMLLQYARDTQNALLIEDALHALHMENSLCSVQHDQVVIYTAAMPDAHILSLLTDLIQDWTHIPPQQLRIIQNANLLEKNTN